MSDNNNLGASALTGTALSSASQIEPASGLAPDGLQSTDANECCGDYEDSECANCGGDGFTYGCSWDWQCDTWDAGEGTCLCTRRCEWCQPLTGAEIAERQKLRDILATALAKDKIAEIRTEGDAL